MRNAGQPAFLQMQFGSTFRNIAHKQNQPYSFAALFDDAISALYIFKSIVAVGRFDFHPIFRCGEVLTIEDSPPAGE